jgi:hypothetical protein
MRKIVIILKKSVIYWFGRFFLGFFGAPNFVYLEYPERFQEQGALGGTSSQ